MTEIEKSYIAGILDGEGYFGIMQRNKNLKDRLRVDYLPVIKVVMIDKKTIDYFQKTFGGWQSIRYFKNTNQRTAYCWSIAGKKINPVLDAVRPYIRIKKRQVEILYKRLSTYALKGGEKGSGGNFKYSQKVYSRIESLYLDIKSLNRRGFVQSERLSEVTSKEDAIV